MNPVHNGQQIGREPYRKKKKMEKQCKKRVCIFCGKRFRNINRFIERVNHWKIRSHMNDLEVSSLQVLSYDSMCGYGMQRQRL